jgi:hypothetical protein
VLIWVTAVLSMEMAMLELLNSYAEAALTWDFVLAAIMAASVVNLKSAINKWRL